MKQHITKEQWDELSDEEKDVYGKFAYYYSHEKPSIGQLIEFLGDNLISITREEDGWWKIELRFNNKIGYFREKELIKVSWEAVKFKLKQ